MAVLWRFAMCGVLTSEELPEKRRGALSEKLIFSGQSKMEGVPALFSYYDLLALDVNR
jgi:hypothetical protein